ncbi:hypothetical protein [Flavobacterium sp. H122]|uniref:hypothetical protein n=1 Tax=Flavobacterium sp. H122 TaxID=2529860 RepID=UPI0010A9DB85|nr:hypothetical protein [Flavobacterium sp. H122]
MKQNFLLAGMLLCNSVFSQYEKGVDGEKNWLVNWTNFKCKSTEYSSPTEILNGVITGTKYLKRGKVYLLMGDVYVANNTILYIEPGTMIRGDFETTGTLIITKGSKIIALGEETDPIVFTSSKGEEERRPGDWGGIVIMGDAPGNKFTGIFDTSFESKYNLYGGTNHDSDSGILKYVRIEFAGKKGKHNKSLSALSLAGVGRKTILNNIQVSFSRDDSYKFYGGNLSAENLISFKPADDDFNFTEGVQANLQNCIAVRSPFTTNSENPRVFEVTTYEDMASSDLTKASTSVRLSKITAIRENEKETGFTDAISYIDNISKVETVNSVFSGFESGYIFSRKINFKNYAVSNIKFNNIYFNSCNNILVSEDKELTKSVNVNYFTAESRFETAKKTVHEIFFSVDFKKIPDLRLKSQGQSFVSNVRLN